MNWMTERQFFLARKWSNSEIRKLGHFFQGRIINVSGWDDRDKQGGCYRSYFPNLSQYQISNYSGERGSQNRSDELYINLEDDLPDALIRQYDLVFNHTTLEHVFDMRKAFRNLCLMSKDAVLIILPWAQVVHSNSSYGDYWRFSPEAVRRLFEAEGLSPIYISGSPMRQSAIYVLGLGVRNVDHWAKVQVPPSMDPHTPLGDWIGSSSILFKAIRKLGLHKKLNLAPRESRSNSAPAPRIKPRSP